MRFLIEKSHAMRENCWQLNSVIYDSSVFFKISHPKVWWLKVPFTLCFYMRALSWSITCFSQFEYLLIVPLKQPSLRPDTTCSASNRAWRYVLTWTWLHSLLPLRAHLWFSVVPLFPSSEDISMAKFEKCISSFNLFIISDYVVFAYKETMQHIN